MMTETLKIDGLAFKIRRSDRRRTLGLTVDRAGELVMHIAALPTCIGAYRRCGRIDARQQGVSR